MKFHFFCFFFFFTISYVFVNTTKSIKTNQRRDLPASYSFYEDYPECLKSNRYQESCASSCVATSLEDRICKKNKDMGIPKYDIEFSIQQVLSLYPGSCLTGGSPSSTFNEYIENGITTESCYPYEARDDLPPLTSCVNSEDFVNDRYQILSYNIVDTSAMVPFEAVEQIKNEVFNNGPVAILYRHPSDPNLFWNHGMTMGTAVFPCHVDSFADNILTVVGWGNDGSDDYFITRIQYGNWGYIINGERGFINLQLYGFCSVERWYTYGDPEPCNKICNSDVFCSGNFPTCNGHGVCFGYDCVCNPQDYFGDQCENYNCSNVYYNNSNVCSSRGECIQPNVCNCTDGYFGIDCESWNCSGIINSDDNTCFNQGNCTAPETCVCESGYGDPEDYCKNPYCNSVKAGDLGECFSHGNCTAPNNCVCETGYGYPSDYCEFPICDGIRAQHSGECFYHGNCTLPGICVCEQGWGDQADFCEFPICNSVIAGQPGECFDHGNCTLPGICVCETGYGDPADFCEFPICNSVIAGQPGECFDHGNCTLPGICVCDNNYNYSSFCNLTVCNNVLSTSNAGCNHRGYCEGYNSCRCLETYVGNYCNDDWKCFEILQSNNSVCGGGKCVDSNICNCSGTGLEGLSCTHCVNDDSCGEDYCGKNTFLSYLNINVECSIGDDFGKMVGDLCEMVFDNVGYGVETGRGSGKMYTYYKSTFPDGVEYLSKMVTCDLFDCGYDGSYFCESTSCSCSIENSHCSSVAQNVLSTLVNSLNISFDIGRRRCRFFHENFGSVFFFENCTSSECIPQIETDTQDTDTQDTQNTDTQDTTDTSGTVPDDTDDDTLDNETSYDKVLTSSELFAVIFVPTAIVGCIAILAIIFSIFFAIYFLYLLRRKRKSKDVEIILDEIDEDDQKVEDKKEEDEEKGEDKEEENKKVEENKEEQKEEDPKKQEDDQKEEEHEVKE